MSDSGWGKPNNSRRWHYFVGGFSLCSRFGFYFGELEQGNEESPDNCANCRRSLQRMKREHGEKLADQKKAQTA